MTVDTSTMTNYTDAIENLPDEAFLGSLLWFSISAADVNLEHARNELTVAGLSTDGMPRILRPVDAYKKASRDVGHKFPWTDGVKSEFMVRDAGESIDGTQVNKHIILERVVQQDGTRHRIVYEKVGELRFNRGVKKNGEYQDYFVESVRTTKSLSTPLTDDEDKWLTGALSEYVDRFDHLLHYMDSHAVRSFVREYIARLSGTCVKESGGLYFVKQEHARELLAMGRWVKSIGSEFHSLPLLNLEEQRQMIMDAFEDETIKEVERLMIEVQKILADPNRKIETRTFDAYGLRAAELRQKVQEYNGMLGARADRATIEISTYAQQVMALQARILETKPATTAPLRKAG